MHTSKIVDPKTLESVMEPQENEVQATLRRALELLGPNGENWTKGIRQEGPSFCAIGAYHQVAHGEPWGFDYHREPAFLFLRTAAIELLPRDEAADAFNHPVRLNNSAKDFSEVRAMFLRAIELAATP